MSRDPKSFYTKEYFLPFLEWKRDYEMLATWLTQNLSFETAIDFGCGNGMLIHQLMHLNKRVLGIDIAAAACEVTPESVRQCIVYRDVSQPIFFGKFDLVISLETAEHLTLESSDQFIDNLVNHTLGPICFSAAVPEQGGSGHINEQPPEFWLSRFARRNYFQNDNHTENFRKFLKDQNCLWWFCNNVQILEKR